MNEQITNWMHKAESDLKAAEILMNQVPEDIPTDIVCFHCQQTVEKYFKAFLISNNILFSRTHDLEYLKIQCSKLDNEFENLDLSELDYYSVEIRYPDDYYIPSYQEAVDALHIARSVRELIINKIL